MASTTSDNAYIPPTSSDARSPCPALNSLASHGYLPRDGRNISFFQLVGALRSVYGISMPFATLLTAGGIMLCGHGLKLDLDGLNRHNAIEHDASLCHRDLDETGGTIVANLPDPKLVQAIIDLSDGKNVTLENLIKAKHDREERANIHSATEYPSTFLCRASRGECTLAASVMGNGQSIPVEIFKTWFEEERIPDKWSPQRTTGLFNTRSSMSRVNREVDALHIAAASERRNV